MYNFPMLFITLRAGTVTAYFFGSGFRIWTAKSPFFSQAAPAPRGKTCGSLLLLLSPDLIYWGKTDWYQPAVSVTIADFYQTWQKTYETYSCKILAFYDLRLRSYGLFKFWPRGRFRSNLGTLNCFFYVIQFFTIIQTNFELVRTRGTNFVIINFKRIIFFTGWSSTSVFDLEYLKPIV